MGRGAGPVYNFQGASGGASKAGGVVDQTIGATLKNATQAVDAAQSSLDNAAISPEMKKQIEASLDASKSGVEQAKAAQSPQ
jgi:hypothetical protein